MKGYAFYPLGRLLDLLDDIRKSKFIYIYIYISVLIGGISFQLVYAAFV